MAYIENETQKELISRLLKGISIILVITFFAAYVFLGTSSDCSNADPVYGGCDTTQDYIPSGKQKSATYAFYAAFLGVPYLWGGLAKYNEIKSKRVKSKSS